jgi:(p)ppGpp synthase/HD superfamily hydrolase
MVTTQVVRTDAATRTGADDELFVALRMAESLGALPPRAVRCIHRALIQAFSIHRGQHRMSGEPYISHPLAMVYMLVLGLGIYDVGVLLLALLHDGPEDQLLRIMPMYDQDRDLAVKRLERRYGCYGPELITDLRILTHASYQSKSCYLRDVAKRGSWRALLVKLLDRYHNLLTLGFREPDDQRCEALMTLEIFPEILRAMLASDAPDAYKGEALWVWFEIHKLCQLYCK